MHLFDELSIQVVGLLNVIKSSSEQFGIDNVSSIRAFPTLDELAFVELEAMVLVVVPRGVDAHSHSCGRRQIGP